MNLILTKHVKERRTKGFIPEKNLIGFSNFLIKEHSLKEKEDGFLKLRKGGTCAVFKKENNKILFITFYGSTGWIMKDDSDFNGFALSFESFEEREKKVDKRIKNKERNRKYLEKKKINKPKKELLKLSFSFKKLIEDGRFLLRKNESDNTYFMIPQMGDLFCYLLNFKGEHIKSIHIVELNS